MLADPLTKLMSAQRLDDAMSNGVLDLEPTPEWKIAKMMKQRQRASKKDDDEIVGEDKE